MATVKDVLNMDNVAMADLTGAGAGVSEVTEAGEASSTTTTTAGRSSPNNGREEEEVNVNVKTNESNEFIGEKEGKAGGADDTDGTAAAAVPAKPTMTLKETPARAWFVLIATFMSQLFTWGFLFAGGIWQRYFYNSQFFGAATQAELAWIGSIAYTVCMVFGIVVGRLSDMFGHRKVYIVGVALNFIAFLLASFVTQLWQLYLTHGVLWGLSVACIYIPASGVSVQYWMHNIAFSISITGAGSGIGGFIWPNTLQAMLDSIGPRWSYRVMAISGLVVLSLCAIVLKPTVVRKAGDPKPRFFKDTDVFFKNKHYWLLSAVAFFLTFGYYVPSYYLAQYSNDTGLPVSTGSLLIAVMNGSALLMRVIQAPLSRYVGANTSFASFIVLGALCQLLIWPFAHNLGSLLAFSILYGFFATGGCFGFFPIVCAESFLSNYASALGLIFAWCAPGGLIGPVVSGVLFDKYSTFAPDGTRTTNYIPMQMFGGGFLMISGLFAWVEWFSQRRDRGVTTVGADGKRKWWTPV